jgi:hypothetical protein
MNWNEQKKAFELLESAIFYLYTEHPEQIDALQILYGALRRLTMEMDSVLLKHCYI